MGGGWSSLCIKWHICQFPGHINIDGVKVLSPRTKEVLRTVPINADGLLFSLGKLCFWL